MEIKFTDIIVSPGLNETLLKPGLTEVIDESNLVSRDDTNLNLMYFTHQKALNASEKFAKESAGTEAQEINENGTKNNMSLYAGPEKGYAIKEYGMRIGITYLANKWYETSNVLNGVSAETKIAIKAFKNNSMKLFNSISMKLDQECVRIVSKGFSITADKGPGSPTPKGISLFNAGHTVKGASVDKTFSNILAVPNQALSADTIAEMLLIHRTKLLMENGYKVTVRPKTYELWIPETLAVVAGNILNTPGSTAGEYTGEGTNSKKISQFYFNGNKVAIQTLEYLGETDQDDILIGLDTMYFLVNPKLLLQSRALKYINLYAPVTKVFKNDETDELVTDIRAGFAVDHYGAENCITGSQGTV